MLNKTMSGTRNPCNILLESDCSYHEPCGGNHTTDYQPSRPQYSDRYSSLECHGTRDTQAYPSPQDTQRPCSTPIDFSARRQECVTPKYDGHCLEQCRPKDNEAGSIQPAEYDGQFTQGILREIHTKSAPPRDFYHKQFRQGIADNSVHEKIGRGPNAHDYLRQWQDVENFGRYRKIDNGCSRDKPECTPFSCNDCMEPQCLYCWRKLREAKGDFSFLDGFETQEPKWRPSKRSVEQYNSFYSGPNHNNSRRQTSLDDRVHHENSKYEQSTSQSSCSLEEPKWIPTNNLHVNHEDNEPKEQHNTRCDTMSKENEWNWPLGKGRGIGPVRGEWIPPFRKQSSEYPTPTFQRSKGVGAIPNSDDWVPPFRGDEQPYNWHRCKGSGGCPPRDQWLAPWCSSIKTKQVDQVCGGR